MTITPSLPFVPNSGESFCRLMQTIWADKCEPDGAGGIMAYTTVWYDDWHDARKVARALGMTRTGSTFIEGYNGDVYRTPDKAWAVRVFNRGSGCKPSRYRARAVV